MEQEKGKHDPRFNKEGNIWFCRACGRTADSKQELNRLPCRPQETSLPAWRVSVPVWPMGG